MLDVFRGPSAVRSDDSKTRRHSLNDHLPEGLGQDRRMNQDVEGAENRPHILDETQKLHLVGDTELDG
ncbi:hypothetical protein Cma02nite_19680 [Cellulomonas marina]|nr:hypothetical protein Cma02nite_19680 [Cellulomonas marina]